MMSNQTVQYERQWAENDFELQLSLERAFAQLQGDEANGPLLKCLEAITLRIQNQSLHNIALKIGIAYEDIQHYLVECQNSLISYPPIKACWKEITVSNHHLLLEHSFVLFDKDKSTWIDLLAGEFVPEADPKMVRETQILRAALLSHLDKSKEALPEPDILNNVLARLEAEGLLAVPFDSPSSDSQEKRSHRSVSSLPWYRNPGYAFAFALVLIAGVLGGLPLLYHPESTEVAGPSDTNISAIAKGRPCLGKIISSQPETVATDLKKELKKVGVTEISLTVINNKSIQAGWRLKANLKQGYFETLSQQYSGLRRYPPDPNYLCVNIISNEPE